MILFHRYNWCILQSTLHRQIRRDYVSRVTFRYEYFNIVPWNQTGRGRCMSQRVIFILPVDLCVILKIRQSQFDASALRFKRRGPLAGPSYTTQKLNLLTGGTDKSFRGPWRGAMADVIELLNRDYLRVIGCGDIEKRNILLCFHLARFLQLSSSLTAASISLCPKHCKFECASLFALVFSLFFFISLLVVPTTAYELVSFFTNRTCVVHGESRQEINAKERKKESLKVLEPFCTLICRDLHNV